MARAKFKMLRRDIDKGLKSLEKTLREDVRQKQVAVGVFGDAGQDLVMIASVHEFGAPTKNIPERSYLRATIDIHQKEYLAFVKKAIGNIAETATRSSVAARSEADRSMALLGTKIVADVQARIRSNIKPTLKPATIRAKGSSVALIDTGRLLQSITYKVEP